MSDNIRETGEQEITPEIDAGYLRHKIEAATGQAVDEHLFDKYHTQQARAARVVPTSAPVNRQQTLTSVRMRRAYPCTSAPTPMPSRGWRLTTACECWVQIRLRSLPTVINGVAADCFADFGISAKSRTEAFKALLGYRGGHDGDLSDGVKAVRYFLKRFGVTLKRRQPMRDGKRSYVYSVDTEEIAEQMAIIAQRRLKAAAEKGNVITSKRQKRLILPSRK